MMNRSIDRNRSRGTVSIVIPAYNEESHLTACLNAIAAQTIKPLEVIVVDNNSSDRTKKIAESYPFVRVVREQRQGVVHARTTGFNAARGEIIARIDADTLLPCDWLATLLGIFEDETVAAVSGRPVYYDLALPELCSVVENALRGRLAHALRDMMFLQGANMGMRRTAWLDVRTHLCRQHNMHEDFDLGIHLQWRGHRVIYAPLLCAGLSARRIDTRFKNFAAYVLMSPHSYRLHNIPNCHRMYPVILATLLLYAPGRLLFLARDPGTGAFSAARLLDRRVRTAERVDPALFGAD